jgi:hypothetical protein
MCFVCRVESQGFVLSFGYVLFFSDVSTCLFSTLSQSASFTFPLCLPAYLGILAAAA